MPDGKATFWDRIAFAYDAAESLNKRAYSAMLQRIAALTPEQAEVLECAAGTGSISLAVASKAKRVLCTDLSLPMLAKAEAKAGKRGFRNISFAARDLLHLPDADERFDVVIAANVIHLLNDPNAALAELWRVTKAGGRLIVPTFLTVDSKRGFRLLIRLYRLLGFRTAHNYTEVEYAGMLANCGLPAPELSILPGRVPVGLAVFQKD